jgi:hypothetical protein
VDIGMPTSSYRLSSVAATIDGQPIADIDSSPYVENGIALGLGGRAIAPGQGGVVQVRVSGVERVLYRADEPEDYASALFSPTWFDAGLVNGTTPMRVTFHLPPGVLPEEPRYYSAAGGWPDEAPEAGFDAQGRIYYSWYNPTADPGRQYTFGAGFPTQYVAASAIATPPPITSNFDPSFLIFMLCCGGFGLLFVGTTVLGARTASRRKLAYLPPKIAIEGHGIKRGLTAVEAAILLETPLDKVLTMMLYSLVRKGAARVAKEKPLAVEKIEPLPDGLREYESGYLNAIVLTAGRQRQKELEKVIVELVRGVQAKMKGFSLRETRDYYRSIVDKAWKQVEQAETPEVKSERYTENLEWQMLDKDFEDRTRRTMSGPVYVPVWWGNFRPSTTSSTVPSRPSARPAPTIARGAPSLPHLPGSDFAASVANSVQSVAGGLVSNVSSFTGRITGTTNPPPPPSRSSRSFGGGGGGGCACACACAGCACACAGGGR